MDFGSITAAFSSLKAMGDITKSLMDLHTTTEVKTRTAELLNRLLEVNQQMFLVQEERAAMNARLRDLEDQIRRMQDWTAEKARYELAQPFPGCMVYALKKSESRGQTAHYLCASCYQDGKPSILQGREGSRRAVYCCSVCETEAVTGYSNVTPPKYFEDITAQG
jgi:cell division protein FtsB